MQHFIDLEQYGKEKRQKNWDSVKSKHSISDIPKVEIEVKTRRYSCAPTRFLTAFLMNWEGVLACEPDVVMLPYFKTVHEVVRLIKLSTAERPTAFFCLKPGKPQSR